MSMLSVDCPSPYIKLVETPRPEFGLTKVIPSGMAPHIEAAVRDFMVSSHLPDGVDQEGFFRQTLQAIAAASYLNQGGDLWLGTSNGRLVTYILAHVGNDYDGRLSYTVSQAWVRKDQRGQKWVKDAWEQVRQRARDCLCKHFVVLSSRGKTAAYCRFLGKGFKPYAEILKQEI
jgi:ligand-binding sensor domain-containing protein